MAYEDIDQGRSLTLGDGVPPYEMESLSVKQNISRKTRTHCPSSHDSQSLQDQCSCCSTGSDSSRRIACNCTHALAGSHPGMASPLRSSSRSKDRLPRRSPCRSIGCPSQTGQRHRAPHQIAHSLRQLLTGSSQDIHVGNNFQPPRFRSTSFGRNIKYFGFI